MQLIKIKKGDSCYNIFRETDEKGVNPSDFLRCTSFLYIYDMSKRYLLHRFPDGELLCEAQAKELARVESLQYVNSLCARATLPDVFKNLLSKDLSEFITAISKVLFMSVGKNDFFSALIIQYKIQSPEYLYLKINV